jgi:DNA-binding CsgD family transcriptional regulator
VFEHVVLDVGSSGAVRAALEGTRSADFVRACDTIEEAIALATEETVAGAIFDGAAVPARWGAAAALVRKRWPGAPILVLAPSVTSSAFRRARALGVRILEGTPAEHHETLVEFVISAHTWRLQQGARVEAWCTEQRLSAREHELAMLAAFGAPRRAWANTFGITPAAVYVMLRRIRERAAIERSRDFVTTVRSLVASVAPPAPRPSSQPPAAPRPSPKPVTAPTAARASASRQATGSTPRRDPSPPSLHDAHSAISSFVTDIGELIRAQILSAVDTAVTEALSLDGARDGRTNAEPSASASGLSIRHARFEFEQGPAGKVRLRVTAPGVSAVLSRSYTRMLYLLASARLEAASPQTSWVEPVELRSKTGEVRKWLNTSTFRCRHDFAKLGFEDAEKIIETTPFGMRFGGVHISVPSPIELRLRSRPGWRR